MCLKCFLKNCAQISYISKIEPKCTHINQSLHYGLGWEYLGNLGGKMIKSVCTVKKRLYFKKITENKVHL